jgi:uncharacterized membrane protein
MVFIVAGSLCALIFSPALEAALGGPGLMGAVAHLAFMKFCHQIPERSLAIGGATLPVCARCTGIYCGVFLGWALWGLMPQKFRGRRISNLALGLGLAPMLMDGALNFLRLFGSPAPIRLITGLIFGAVGARALWPAVRQAAMDAGATLVAIRFSNDNNVEAVKKLRD